MELLKKTIEGIRPISKDIVKKAREREDSLTKPRGALGRLEDLAVQVAGIQNRVDPKIEDKVCLLFAGDHLTVHEEDIASAPLEVTVQMMENFIVTKGAGVNVIADKVGARVVVTDIGVASCYPDSLEVYKKAISKGAKNITKGPAMTYDEAVKSLETGIEIFNIEKEKGIDILAVGEMGIGNTTPSSAIFAVVTEESLDEITGPGAGIVDDKLSKKRSVIKKALEINTINKEDGIDILSKVGGFEIGGMAGAMIAAAAKKTPVMVDGFIATAAAIIAIKIAPECEPYLIAAHHSAERGYGKVVDFLNRKPLLDLGMRLGEGTGALIGISLAEIAVATLNSMSTFEEAAVIMAKERNTL